ncbi:MAG TPA: oligopeptide/dipeptide ABC transporter ATP-binding protein [Burkholderiales bacterium]
MTSAAPAPLLELRDVSVEYPLGRRRVLRAVDRVSFALHHGEVLALVGESGCGKSSVARAVMQLEPIADGRVLLEGRDLARLAPAELKLARRRFQMIFQDPLASLNPRRRVRDILEAPLRIHGVPAAERRRRVARVLELVHLDPHAVLDRYPHMFSGGQCQRLSIARAIVLEPALLVCDEAVSALDVSVRAQVLNVLHDLREELGLGMLFISHDLAVVRNVAHRVAVMYLGRICEIGSSARIFSAPAHPYTVALMSAVPIADPDVPPPVVPVRAGEMPSPLAPPSGCRFRTRCPSADRRCAEEAPALRAIATDHSVACHYPGSVPLAQRTPDPS